MSCLEVGASITFVWMHNDMGQEEVARQMSAWQLRLRFPRKSEIIFVGRRAPEQLRLC
jgi:hypothetical protein